MNIFLVTFIFCCLMHVHADILKAYATVPQLVSSAGYPIEKHYAHTSDGYILQIYRIPHGVTKRGNEKKKAIVLFHGLFGNCDNYILMGPKNSLGYFLADAGYDVWLANLRGNLHTSHRNLTRKDPSFWDYSFDEHGKYDAPAIIDKILEETGLSRLLYIGHSMGCTTFLTMLAWRPEYNDKLVAFVGLAPAAYLDNIRGLVNFLLYRIDMHVFFVKKNIRAIYLSRNVLEIISEYCIATRSQTDLCLRIAYAIMGDDFEQHPSDMTKAIIMRMHPASTRQLFHFAKFTQTGVLTSWEDGLEGRVRPYNLTNIRTPVSIWYGENDQLTEKSQILRLASALNETGTLHSVTPVAWNKFNHLDFVFAKDVGKILNVPLVAHVKELFDEYDKE